MRRKIAIFVSLLPIALSGCWRGHREEVSYEQLLEPLRDPVSIARLDARESFLVSSSDPARLNIDYNKPIRVAPDGWWVIADLDGPGYISRFWFTTSNPNHRIRLYFDNEKQPRLETTVRAFCGGMEPFLKPLAAYENLCYYNYVPIPYAKRLVVMVEPGGYEPNDWPRVFHQINYSTLSKNSNVRSLRLPLDAASAEALQDVARAWGQGEDSRDSKGDFKSEEESVMIRSLRLLPGSGEVLLELEGPAMIVEARVVPRLDPDIKPVDSERFLRDIMVRIRWNGAESCSVESPLGDFFGSFWQRILFESLYFGLASDSLFCRLPMPFEERAEISFENQGEQTVELEVLLRVRPIEWDASFGYLHAAWRRSSPYDRGMPHEIVQLEGKGRFVGCILSATSLDQTFWLLEGNEYMWRDGEAEPFWKGTGLEDYFNGGWYYQNVLAKPLHGLPFKTFFRTVQYRMHLPDPVVFQTAFAMLFERGPNNVSHGWMESLAYYYLERPSRAPSTLMGAPNRAPPLDQFDQITIMLQLFSFERFSDYAGARRLIDRFVARYPEFPYNEMLQLRRAAYTEKLDGFDAARPVYELIAVNSTNESVRAQAKDLLWFHESESHALLGIYCNAEMRLVLDGRSMARAGVDHALSVYRHELKQGKHFLALQIQSRQYPFWVQLFLRTHSGDVFTTTDWKHKYDPTGEWWIASYDSGDWTPIRWTSTKGPPDEPLIWVEPNAFVDMQTKPEGIWPTVDWPDERRPVVLRKEFRTE